MKVITTILWLFFFSFAAHAADKPDRGLALEFLEVARYEQVINSTLDTYNQQIFQGLPDAVRAQMDKMMREVMGWEATKNQLIDLVVNIYTAAELKAYIAFMKTPLGASATAKSDEFSKQLSTLLSQNIMKFISEHPVQPDQAGNPSAPR